jgi:hypothetical protein
MPVKQLMIAAAGATLMVAALPAATPARAAAPAYCGGSLVAGLSLCLTWEMRVSEYRALIARANAGDRDAALTLAQFEDERAFANHSGPGGGKWWARAAQLGECQALRRMRDAADQGRNAKAAAQWRKQIDRYNCTLQADGERWMGGPWMRDK